MVYFKTKLNPLIPLISKLLAVILGAGVILFLWLIIYDPFSILDSGWKVIVGLVGYLYLMGYLSYTLFSNLIASTKSYIISEHEIEVQDHLSRNVYNIPKENVKGYSTTWFPKKGDKVLSIIIYLVSNEKLELYYTHYFNFKSILPALDQAGFKYLGKEIMRRKWIYFGTRIYKYDN